MAAAGEDQWRKHDRGFDDYNHSQTQFISDVCLFFDYQKRVNNEVKEAQGKHGDTLSAVGASLIRIETTLGRLPAIEKQVDDMMKNGPIACRLHEDKGNWMDFFGTFNGPRGFRTSGLTAVLAILLIFVLIYKWGPELWQVASK